MLHRLDRRTVRYSTQAVFLSLVFCSLLAGCRTTGSGPPVTQAAQTAPQVSGPVVEVSIGIGLTAALFAMPQVRAAISSARAARLQVAVAASAQNSKVHVEGSVGFAGDSAQGMERAARVSVTGERPLVDFGQTDRRVALAALRAEIAQQQARGAIDAALANVLRQFGKRRSAARTLTIIDHYLTLYHARAALIEAAVASGVMSTSDVLEIKALKNQILSQRAKADLAKQVSSTALKLALEPQYDAAIADLRSGVDALAPPSFEIPNSVAARLVQLRQSDARLQIELEANAGKPVGHFRTSVTSPTFDDPDTSLFAGVTFSMPVKDGGVAKAKIAGLEQALATLGHEQVLLEQTSKLAQSEWQSFAKFYEVETTLLEQRLRISRARVEALELRLRAGRTDVKTLVKEILSSAQSQVAQVELQGDLLSQSIKAAVKVQSTCTLIRLCGDIATIFEGLPP